MYNLGDHSVGVHTFWIRTYLKATLKYYFMKFSLFQCSDLGYWFAGKQKSAEQVEDVEGIFFFFFF